MTATQKRRPLGGGAAPDATHAGESTPRRNFFEGMNFKSVSYVAPLPLGDKQRDTMDQLIADATADGRYGISKITSPKGVRLLITRNPTRAA